MNQKTVIIGVDVGGTKILIEGFDKNGKVCEKITEKTVVKNEKAFMDHLTSLLDGCFHKGIKGIGVAVPGIVERSTGAVVRAPHLPLKKTFPLKKLLEKRYKVPVIVDNDINAFLFAEKDRKELVGQKNIVAVMVGTGVGGAVIANGAMLYGKNGFAGEVGHMVIGACESQRTLEQSVGGHFIPQIAKRLGIKKPMTALDLDIDTPDTRKVKKALVEDFGLGLANLNLIFNPETIVLGGSIYHLFIEPEKKRLEKIIAGRSLDGKSPKLLSARKGTSVAEGAGKLLKKTSI